MSNHSEVFALLQRYKKALTHTMTSKFVTALFGLVGYWPMQALFHP
jgi:hypothetical protein